MGVLSVVEKLKFKPGSLKDDKYHVIIAAVSHAEYLQLKEKDLAKALNTPGIFYDLKSVMDEESVSKRGRKYLAL